MHMLRISQGADGHRRVRSHGETGVGIFSNFPVQRSTDSGANELKGNEARTRRRP